MTPLQLRRTIEANKTRNMDQGTLFPLSIRPTMREGGKRRVHYAARQTFSDVRIPEDATHESVAFFGQKR